MSRAATRPQALRGPALFGARIRGLRRAEDSLGHAHRGVRGGAPHGRAGRRPLRDDAVQRAHTFLFHLGGDDYIDAAHGGNDSRFINHSCDPNCESDVVDGHVYITAIRDIEPGEELTYDYSLEVEEEPLQPAEDRLCVPLRCREVPGHDDRGAIRVTGGRVAGARRGIMTGRERTPRQHRVPDRPAPERLRAAGRRGRATRLRRRVRLQRSPVPAGLAAAARDRPSHPARGPGAGGGEPVHLPPGQHRRARRAHRRGVGRARLPRPRARGVARIHRYHAPAGGDRPARGL